MGGLTIAAWICRAIAWYSLKPGKPAIAAASYCCICIMLLCCPPGCCCCGSYAAPHACGNGSAPMGGSGMGGVEGGFVLARPMSADSQGPPARSAANADTGGGLLLSCAPCCIAVGRVGIIACGGGVMPTPPAPPGCCWCGLDGSDWGLKSAMGTGLGAPAPACHPASSQCHPASS